MTLESGQFPLPRCRTLISRTAPDAYAVPHVQREGSHEHSSRADLVTTPHVAKKQLTPPQFRMSCSSCTGLRISRHQGVVVAQPSEEYRTRGDCDQPPEVRRAALGYGIVVDLRGVLQATAMWEWYPSSPGGIIASSGRLWLFRLLRGSNHSL